jgi:hypothetical protein
MNRFADILREADARLDLPPAARARILLEMAADLDDLYDHHRLLGLREEEAEERARQAFALSDEVLADLVDIHASGARRLLDQIGEQARRAWERVACVLLLLSVAMFSGGRIVSVGVVRDAGPVGWLIVAITAVAFAVAAVAFYVLYIREDRDLHRLRTLLPVIIVLGAVDLLVGFYGWWLGFYLWLRTYAVAREHDLELFIITLRDGAALSVVALVCAAIAALMWYVLHARLECVEHDAALALMETGTDPTTAA